MDRGDINGLVACADMCNMCMIEVKLRFETQDGQINNFSDQPQSAFVEGGPHLPTS